MGNFSYNFSMADFSLLKTLQDFIFSNLLRLFAFHKNDDDPYAAAREEFLRSSSFEHFHKHLVSKDDLPIVQYMKLKPRRLAQNDDAEEDDFCCAVCLRSIEEWHNVRELGNCEHVFHVECLDSWMDHGRRSCPVCRAELLPGHGGGLSLEEDPKVGVIHE